MASRLGNGDGNTAVRIGDEIGCFSVNGNLCTFNGNGNGIPISVKSRSGQNERKAFAALCGYGCFIKVAVFIGPRFKIGVHKGVDPVAVLHGVGERHRTCIVYIVSVASAVFASPKLGERETVVTLLGCVSGSGTALEFSFMRKVQCVVYRDRTVAVGIGEIDLFKNEHKLSVLVRYRYISRCAVRRERGNRGCTDHEHYRYKCGHDFLCHFTFSFFYLMMSFYHIYRRKSILNSFFFTARCNISLTNRQFIFFSPHGRLFH